MPAAIKLQEEFGDALQVLLVESQGTGHEESVGFAMKAKWLGNDAIWTSDYLFSTGASGLPNFALIGPDGKVVLTGNPLSMHGQIEEEIERMIKKDSGAPAEAPKSVHKAYMDIAKGNYAKAVAAADKIAEKAKEAAEVEYAKGAVTAVLARVDQRVERVRWMAANGYPARAEEMAKTLTKGVKGHADLEAKVADLGELLTSEAFAAELKAEKSLAKLEAKLYEDPKNEKLHKKVQEFAADHAGTKVGERASALVDVAGYVVM